MRFRNVRLPESRARLRVRVRVGGAAWWELEAVDIGSSLVQIVAEQINV